MVSKVAVIALVAIFAVPIMLGYGMNLDEVTLTDYKVNDDSVNVTPLLQTGTDWSIARGDPYQMNDATGLVYNSANNQFAIMPIYNKISSQKTSIPVYGGNLINFGGGTESHIQQMEHYQIAFDYSPASGVYVRAIGYEGGTQVFTHNYVTFVSWNASTATVDIGMKTSEYSESWGTEDNMSGLTAINFTLVNLSGVNAYYLAVPKTGSGLYDLYADISEGYYFRKFSNQPRIEGWDINLPENSISAVMSINLDSITAANYTLTIENGYYSAADTVRLVKTTTGGAVKWQLLGENGQSIDLYYDSSRYDNTYQMVFTDKGASGIYYFGEIEMRYIGSWQKIIGEANYYQSYKLEYREREPVLNKINLRANDGTTARTPTIRIDAAEFRAFEFPVIEGYTYTPANFKDNPATTISNIQKYGSRIIFGGNTYDVSNGDIMLGTHKVPLNGLTFQSVPNPDTLGYDNKIGNTIVSTTANPSTIQFIGKWSASVSTASMEEYQYTKTEWNVGEFAWDGIDHNFLIVGLLTSLGAFIGLAIYSRRSKTSLLPLLVVCGGAAMLFLFML